MYKNLKRCYIFFKKSENIGKLIILKWIIINKQTFTYLKNQL